MLKQTFVPLLKISNKFNFSASISPPSQSRLPLQEILTTFNCKPTTNFSNKKMFL